MSEQEQADDAGTLGALPPGPDLAARRQLARMATRPLAFLEEARQAFGDVFTIRPADESPWTIVADPDLIRQVLGAPADRLHAAEGRHVLRPILGDSSVFLVDEARHMEQRRLLLPPFAAGHVERFREQMRAAAERAMEQWPAGREEPAAPWTRAISLEVILRTVFGATDGGRLPPLREALRELPLPGNASEARAPAFVDALARVDELVYAEIAGRAGATGDDVLALLLRARHEDGSPMSRTEIRDELMSLLVAGYETTATGLAWALALLARDPARQALAGEEARGGGGAYLDAVVRETLRLRPPVPLVPRFTVEPFELGEHLLPAGTTVVAAILLLHHRPDLYRDPAEFRPERFLDSQPDPSGWLPFGGGVRRCIGARFALLEMQAVLSVLLARADVRSAEPRPESMRSRDVTLTPARGAPVILEPRRATGP